MTKHQWPAYNLQQVLARLPSFAARKYRNLTALAEDADVLVRASFARQQSLEGQAADLELRIETCDPHTEGDIINDLRDQIANLREDARKADTERSRRMAAKVNAEQVLAQLNGFVMTLGIDRAGVEVRFRPVNVQAKPREGESLADAIVRVRREIASAKAELADVRAAPPSADEIKQSVTAQIDRLAAQGRPSLSFDKGQVKVHFADVMQFAQRGAVLSAPSGSAGSLICWLFRDRVLNALLDGVDDEDSGISSQERQEREADLKARILAFEHEEETLICTALESGVECLRNPYTSGWALLGIEVNRSVAVTSIAAE